MMDWKPRESAPKDGSEILVAYLDYSGRADFSLVRFEQGKWIAQADGQRAIESQGDTYTDYFEPFFTHWMPLPAPPTPTQEA